MRIPAKLGTRQWGKHGVHAALLAANRRRQHVELALQPIFVDVGAAAYGTLEDADGSDSLLLAARFAKFKQPVSVHAFEMQPGQAAKLVATGRELNLKNYTVHIIGVGAKPAQLRVGSVVGKVRSLTLVDKSSRRGVPKPLAKGVRNYVDAATLRSIVNVTTIDLFAAGLDRPIFYIKVDTEGHEWEVLRGMQALLRASPPAFLSFEYATGWSTRILRLERLKAAEPAGGIKRWARDELGDGASLREFVPLLTMHGYSVFLLHTEGLVRIDGEWWAEFYELILLRDRQVSCWHDLFAAQRGPPLRALLATFHVRPLPCIPSHKRGQCREKPALAATLGPSCDCLSAI